MKTNRPLVYWIALFAIFCSYASSAHAQQKVPPSVPEAPRDWIFNGYSDGIKGIGIAPYNHFDPDKAWEKAIKNGINDLNANHSLIVYSYGKQIGRGPLRTDTNFAIRNLLDSTQVSVVDSARWKGRAFVLVKPTVSVSDSVIYPQGDFRTPDSDLITRRTVKLDSGRSWLESTGSIPSINSNWYMSITKAKQEALRKLAENLAVEVSTETYARGRSSRRYYSFSSMIAFQRIRILKRTFGSDSVTVKVAVDPREVKMMMD